MQVLVGFHFRKFLLDEWCLALTQEPSISNLHKHTLGIWQDTEQNLSVLVSRNINITIYYQRRLYDLSMTSPRYNRSYRNLSKITTHTETEN